MKTTIEILREGLEYLSVPEHWCGGLRWKSDGSNCALGVLERVCFPAMNHENWNTQPKLFPTFPQLEVMEPTSRLAQAAKILDPTLQTWNCDCATVVFFNNTYGWERTKEMFELAIELEQKHIDQKAKELIESADQEAAEHQAVLSHMR